MRIRPYTSGEENILLAIFQSAVHGLASGDYTVQQIEAWAPSAVSEEFRTQWAYRIQANQPWVVEIDGQLVAFADLQPSGYIDHFFVAATFAGQGIGSALMRHLQEHAICRDIPTLFAHVSLTAQPLFQRFGFVVEKEQHPVIRGVGLRNAVMSKAVDGTTVRVKD
ncbi:MAG: GNAT family N-acetyltransferase [Burkholderiaceae bacterium]|nr:GNAT family N-acetyltransferase [Burkholderiaceae bacterium]